VKPAERVYLIGGGACTSVGATLAASAAAVRAGIASFGNHPYMVDSVSNPFVVAQAGCVPEPFDSAVRLLAMAASAADEALEPLLHLTSLLRGLHVIVGLPAWRPGLPPGLPHAFADRLRGHLAVRCPTGNVETIACGHAAGLMALGAAWNKIRLGATSACLVGGVDSYLAAETLEWLEDCDQVHGAGPRNNAWGFVPGEAAGFCLLVSGEALQSLRTAPWAEVHSVAVAWEENLIKTETICLGRGLTEAFELAFNAIAAPWVAIDNTFCDMNGEPYRSDEFGFATLRTAERFVDASRFDAPADCWGDVGAASGPLLVNLAATAQRKCYADSKRTLVWASSESGERAAAVLGFEDLRRGGES
jgi:3-oxoacyl-[acyl-carrier-protein] synthase-1